MTHASLATVEQLFKYKSEGFRLEQFPGYTTDQWGIKAHNRPWIEDVGGFAHGQSIIEVGGGYSLLPEYLAEKYELEAWIGDDFGMSSGEPGWSRWGNPVELPQKHPSVKYVFERFGGFSPSYPEEYFQRVFSVSTLEHVPVSSRVSVLRDMHRCLAKGGRQMHTIDVRTGSPKRVFLASILDRCPLLPRTVDKYRSEIRRWIEVFGASGVSIETSIPDPMELLDRRILVESPDVVYRFYPPNNTPKAYSPNASLLIVIEDC